MCRYGVNLQITIENKIDQKLNFPDVTLIGMGIEKTEPIISIDNILPTKRWNYLKFGEYT